MNNDARLARMAEYDQDHKGERRQLLLDVWFSIYPSLYAFFLAAAWFWPDHTMSLYTRPKSSAFSCAACRMAEI